MLRKFIPVIALALGTWAALPMAAEAASGSGGGFRGGFDGFGRQSSRARSFHIGIVGFRGGFHPGFGEFRRGFRPGFSEFRRGFRPGLFGIGSGFDPRVASAFFREWWQNRSRQDLSSFGPGWALAPFIEATIATYFYRNGDHVASEGGFYSGAPCDAACIRGRYLRTSAAAPTTPSAETADIPIYDVNRNCATLEGAPSRNFCLKQEQESYDLIKDLWSDVPDKTKGQTLKKMSEILRGAPTATHPYQTMRGYLLTYLQRDELVRAAAPFHN